MSKVPRSWAVDLWIKCSNNSLFQLSDVLQTRVLMADMATDNSSAKCAQVHYTYIYSLITDIFYRPMQLSECVSSKIRMLKT